MYVRGLDLGGSSVRYGVSLDDIKTYDSSVMEIAPTEQTKGQVDIDKTTDFVIKKATRSSLEGRRFVRDEAMSQYYGKMLSCDNRGAKALQDIMYINAFYALAVECVTKEMNDVEFSLYICIPAAEFFEDKKNYKSTVRDQLSGETVVYFPLLDKTVRFNIERNKITLTAEGVVASFRFATNKSFTTGRTAVVDVGYRSTDITILNEFKPVGASAASRPVGGINLEAAIQGALERDNILVSSNADVRRALVHRYLVVDGDLVDISEYVDKAQRRYKQGQDLQEEILNELLAAGFTVTRKDVYDAMTNYYVMQGQNVLNITEYVSSSKVDFASEIANRIVEVLNAKMMSVSSVNNLFCIGRPFSGLPEDENNLVNLLQKALDADVRVFSIPDTGYANISEIMRVLDAKYKD